MFENAGAMLFSMIIIAGGVRSEDESILRETSGARGLQTQADRGRRGRNAEKPHHPAEGTWRFVMYDQRCGEEPSFLSVLGDRFAFHYGDAVMERYKWQCLQELARNDFLDVLTFGLLNLPHSDCSWGPLD